MSERPAYHRERLPEVDTYSGRKPGEPVPLHECARYAQAYAEDLIVFEAAQRRGLAGMAPGTAGGAIPGQPDPMVVLKADAFVTLAQLARVIAGPQGSGREAKVRAFLKRLIADELRAAGAPPHDAEAAAVDARIIEP